MCVLTYGALPGSAQAAGFALYEWSNRGNAMGGATIATQTPGASCIASNPAAMTRIEGAALEAGATVISPTADVEFENGETDHVTQRAFVVPNAFVTQQVDDNWWFGVGEFTRFGLGTQYDAGWAGRGNMYQAILETFSINPNVAYKINDELSVAAGVEYVFGSMDLRKDNRILFGAFNEWILKPKGDAWGWDLAAHYVPTDWLSFGATYRSSLRFFGTGQGKFTDSGGDDQMKMRATFPSSISTGMAIKATDNLTFELDYIYTMWSEFRKMTYLFSEKTRDQLADINDLTIDSIKDYNDAFRIQFGVEWQAWQDVFLRAGYVFDESPQNKDYCDYMLPSNDRQILSTGLGLVFDQMTVDFSLMYLVASSREIDNNVTGTLDSNIENSKAYMGGLSVSYKF